MAKRNAFGSFLLYLCGVLVIGGAALGGWRMWHDKTTALSAARQALAEGATVGQRVALNLPDEVGNGGRIQPVTAGQ